MMIGQVGWEKTDLIRALKYLAAVLVRLPTKEEREKLSREEDKIKFIDFTF